jgi:hypothetical protein
MRVAVAKEKRQLELQTKTSQVEASNSSVALPTTRISDDVTNISQNNSIPSKPKFCDIPMEICDGFVVFIDGIILAKQADVNSGEFKLRVGVFDQYGSKINRIRESDWQALNINGINKKNDFIVVRGKNDII